MPVRKRGDTWYIDLQIAGQRIRTTAGAGSTKSQALELEAKIRQDFHAGRVGRKVDRLISEAINQWLKGEAAHLKSIDKLESHITRLLPHIKGKTFAQIHDVVDSVKKLKLKPATINRSLAALRRTCNLAHQWGWIENKPTVKLLPENNARHEYLTISQVRELSAACSPDIGEVVMLAAFTGLRRGEIFGLTEDNRRDGCIFLTTETKTGRPRVVPIPKEIEHIKFPVRVTMPQLRAGFNLARAKLGLEHIHFHDLRHTYASWLVQSGAPMVAVRDLLGHANLSVTSRYSHLSVAHLRLAVDNLQNGTNPSQDDKTDTA